MKNQMLPGIALIIVIAAATGARPGRGRAGRVRFQGQPPLDDRRPGWCSPAKRRRAP
jgi:hypothetical protein